MWEGIIPSLRAQIEQKGRGRASSLSSWAETSIFPVLRLQCSWFSGFHMQTRTYTISLLILKPLNLDWITPLAFLVLQLADNRLWDFSSSISMWANSYNKSPLTYLCPCLCLYLYLPNLLVSFLWRAPVHSVVFSVWPIEAHGSFLHSLETEQN